MKVSDSTAAVSTESQVAWTTAHASNFDPPYHAEQLERRLREIQEHVIAHAPGLWDHELESMFLDLYEGFENYVRGTIPPRGVWDDGRDLYARGFNFTLRQLSVLVAFANRVTTIANESSNQPLDRAGLRQLCDQHWQDWQAAHGKFFDGEPPYLPHDAIVE